MPQAEVTRPGDYAVSASRARRAVRLRRGLAILLGLSFAAAVSETALPDVHDADAMLATAGLNAGAAAGAAHVADRSPDETGAGHQTSVPDGGPSHSTHVDHCSHGHIASKAAVCELPSVARQHDFRPGSGSATLASVARAPHSRPPIV